MRRSFAAFVILLYTLAGYGGDFVQKEYDRLQKTSAALTQKIWEIPEAKQFQELFSPEGSYIYYLNRVQDAPVFTATAYLHDRYVLNLRIEFRYDKTSLQITSRGDLAVGVEEIVTVTRSTGDSNGQLGIKHGRTHNLDAASWRKLYAAKGDFSVLGVELKTHSPVSGFEEIRKRTIREDWAGASLK